jgi:hypothetical protein
MKAYRLFHFILTLGMYIAILSFSTQPTFCQSSQKVEVSLGIGITSPSESNPFNISNEPELSTSFGGNAGIRWPIGDMMFVGLRGFLTVQNLSNYQVQQTGSTTIKTLDFRLTSYMFAVDTKIYLIDSRYVEPYLLIAIAYAAGSISNGDYGNLSYQGFTAGGGLGIRVAITKTIGVSVDVIHLAGKGNWKNKPFNNSSSNEYDPSRTWISANISFSVGH